jgi:arsenate reductase
MKNIVFICSWNACRSQMAEGFGKKLSKGDFEVRSAGLNAGGVNSDAIAAMREIDIDISNQTSDQLTQTHYDWADYVVTVCDAAKDSCPVVPPGKKTVHWSIPDPYGHYRTVEEQQANFRKVDKISNLYAQIRAGEL